MTTFKLLIITIILSNYSFAEASPIEIKPTDNISLPNIISWNPKLAANLIEGELEINANFAGVLDVKTLDSSQQYWIIPDLSPTIKSNTYNLHDSLDLVIPRQSFQNKSGELKITKYLPGEFPINIQGQSARIPAFCADLSGISLSLIHI